MKVTLKVWRQAGPAVRGRLVSYLVDGVSADMSFLELLDHLNDGLEAAGEEPVAFDHDCREGICGMCGLVIDGIAHGGRGTTTCQLHLRHLEDGSTLTVEPWRAGPFPVLKDLIVDRSAFDRIIQAGGFVSTAIGAAPDAHAVIVPKANADVAFDNAVCIGCGACVAACPNASAMLFVSAKVSHLALMPQGVPERRTRVQRMVAQMDAEGFGPCSNTGECAAVCPKGIPLESINRLNRELMASLVSGEGGDA